MPKMKSHRGAAKRFTVTKSGRVKRAKAFKRHILTKKSAKRKRNLRQPGYLIGADAENIKKILPY